MVIFKGQNFHEFHAKQCLHENIIAIILCMINKYYCMAKLYYLELSHKERNTKIQFLSFSQNFHASKSSVYTYGRTTANQNLLTNRINQSVVIKLSVNHEKSVLLKFHIQVRWLPRCLGSFSALGVYVDFVVVTPCSTSLASL